MPKNFRFYIEEDKFNNLRDLLEGRIHIVETVIEEIEEEKKLEEEQPQENKYVPELFDLNPIIYPSPIIPLGRRGKNTKKTSKKNKKNKINKRNHFKSHKKRRAGNETNRINKLYEKLMENRLRVADNVADNVTDNVADNVAFVDLPVIAENNSHSENREQDEMVNVDSSLERENALDCNLPELEASNVAENLVGEIPLAESANLDKESELNLSDNEIIVDTTMPKVNPIESKEDKEFRLFERNVIKSEVDLKFTEKNLKTVNLIDRKNFNEIKKIEKEIKKATNAVTQGKFIFTRDFPESKFINMDLDLVEEKFEGKNLAEFLIWQRNVAIKIEKKEREEERARIFKDKVRVLQELFEKIKKASECQETTPIPRPKNKKKNQFVSKNKVNASKSANTLYRKNK